MSALLHRPTRSFDRKGKDAHPSPRGRAAMYISVRTGPAAAACIRLTRKPRAGSDCPHWTRCWRAASRRMRSTTSAISAAVRLGHRALSLAVRVRQAMRETMLRVRDQLLHARTLRSTASFKRSIRLFLSRSAQNLLKQHCAKEATRRTASHMRRALHCWGFSRRRHSCQASRL